MYSRATRTFAGEAVDPEVVERSDRHIVFGIEEQLFKEAANDEELAEDAKTVELQNVAQKVLGEDWQRIVEAEEARRLADGLEMMG